MIKFISILSLILLIFLSSCDCLQVVRGTVVDAETGRPLSGVFVRKENRAYDQAETTEEGTFEISSISGGLFGCPAMTVKLEAPGYASQKLKIRAGGYKLIELTPLQP